MKNGHNIKHWLQSKKLWCWFYAVNAFHTVAIFMIMYGMQLGATIVEGIAGVITVGYILGQTYVDAGGRIAVGIAEALGGRRKLAEDE